MRERDMDKEYLFLEAEEAAIFKDRGGVEVEEIDSGVDVVDLDQLLDMTDENSRSVGAWGRRRRRRSRKKANNLWRDFRILQNLTRELRASLLAGIKFIWRERGIHMHVRERWWCIWRGKTAKKKKRNKKEKEKKREKTPGSTWLSPTRGWLNLGLSELVPESIFSHSAQEGCLIHSLSFLNLLSFSFHLSHEFVGLSKHASEKSEKWRETLEMLK